MYDPNHILRREERKLLAEQPGRRISLIKVFILPAAAVKVLRWLCKLLPSLHCSPDWLEQKTLAGTIWRHGDTAALKTPPSFSKSFLTMSFLHMGKLSIYYHLNCEQSRTSAHLCSQLPCNWNSHFCTFPSSEVNKYCFLNQNWEGLDCKNKQTAPALRCISALTGGLQCWQQMAVFITVGF